MKKLILIRHAKSDWSEPELHDSERGLGEKGKRQVKEVGKLLKKKEFSPDFILCSTAKRALLTLEGLEENYHHLKKIDRKMLKEIYDNHLNGFRKILKIVEETGKNIDSLAIIGHNPSFDEIIETTTGSIGFHLKTLGIAEIRFDVKKWKDIGEIQGELRVITNGEE